MLGGSAITLILQIFLGAEAQVGFFLVEQSLGVCAIDFEAVRLPIRSVATANVGTFVPVEAKPFQVGDELIFKARFTAIHVGVFDAEDHGAALLPREEPVEERGAGVSDM